MKHHERSERMWWSGADHVTLPYLALPAISGLVKGDLQFELQLSCKPRIVMPHMILKYCGDLWGLIHSPTLLMNSCSIGSCNLCILCLHSLHSLQTSKGRPLRFHLMWETREACWRKWCMAFKGHQHPYPGCTDMDFLVKPYYRGDTYFWELPNPWFTDWPNFNNTHSRCHFLKSCVNKCTPCIFICIRYFKKQRAYLSKIVCLLIWDHLYIGFGS